MGSKIAIEPIIVGVLFVIMLRDSFLGHMFGTTIFNAFIFATMAYLLVFRVSFTKLITFVLFFLILQLIATLSNYDLIEIGGYKTLVIGSLNWLMLAAYFKEIDSEKLLRYIALLTILFLNVNYFVYFMQWQYIPQHLSFIFAGLFLNQNTTSMILLALLVFMVVLQKRSKLWIDILIIITYFTIFLTQARAALLAATLLLLYYYKKRLWLIVPLLIFAIEMVSLISSDFLDRFYLKITEAGSTHRVEFWMQVLKGMLEDFHTFFLGYGENRTVVNYLGNNLSVHSSYVNFFANYGFLVSLLLFLFLLYILYDAYKHSVLLAVGLAVLLLHGVFETVLFLGFKVTWVTFIFLYAIREQIGKREES